MSYRLILLGLLAEKPRYGYDLKQTIEARNFADYIRLSGGGLYYNLRKLLEEGYIAEQTVEREGNYPDRHIYQITERGREYLLQLLRETLDDVKGRQCYDPLDAVFAFGSLLPKEEMTARLRYHIDKMRPTLQELAFIADALHAVFPLADPYTVLIVEHAHHRVQNEITWMEQAVARIETDPSFDAAYRKQKIEEMPFDCEAVAAKLSGELNEYINGISEEVKTYWARAGVAWYDYKRVVSGPEPDPATVQQVKESYTHNVANAWQIYCTTLAEKRRAAEAAAAHIREDFTHNDARLSETEVDKAGSIQQ